MNQYFEKKYLNEKALSFVFEQINKFDSISPYLNKFISTNKLEIWGLFPKDINDLTDFDSGGKYNYDPTSEYSKVVMKYLLENSNYVWLLIDNNGDINASPESNAIDNLTTVFFYQDLVMHLLTEKPMTIEKINKTFKLGGAYPFIGFISKMDSYLEDKILKNQVESKDVEFLINNILIIVLGAYDEEGYLIVEIV
ncbi:MAG: hypothetical protein L0Y79_10875 [Chlorobi bacterium]|nr:hypothetical protein [Chlorobiota bacterium]MCI0715560.1 hypothetical protein [Chlorobiota bacterium]